MFYFNKVFKTYIGRYATDIDNIFLLKNGKVDVEKYSRQLIERQIGFEGLHFLLARIQQSFILLNILWKIMLTHDKEYVIFNYTFEVIVGQMFEEYTFIKNVLKRVEDDLEETKKNGEEWLFEFLYLFESFTWKNKRLIEMYEKFNWYFKQHLIRFPTIFYFEERNKEKLNKLLVKNRPSVDKKKHRIVDNLNYVELGDFAKKYFETVSEVNKGNDKDWLLFSRNSILNKLEVDVVQKKTSMEEVALDTGNSDEEEEKKNNGKEKDFEMKIE